MLTLDLVLLNRTVTKLQPAVQLVFRLNKHTFEGGFRALRIIPSPLPQSEGRQKTRRIQLPTDNLKDIQPIWCPSHQRPLLFISEEARQSAYGQQSSLVDFEVTSFLAAKLIEAFDCHQEVYKQASGILKQNQCGINSGIS